MKFKDLKPLIKQENLKIFLVSDVYKGITEIAETNKKEDQLGSYYDNFEVVSISGDGCCALDIYLGEK